MILSQTSYPDSVPTEDTSRQLGPHSRGAQVHGLEVQRLGEDLAELREQRVHQVRVAYHHLTQKAPVSTQGDRRDRVELMKLLQCRGQQQASDTNGGAEDGPLQEVL